MIDEINHIPFLHTILDNCDLVGSRDKKNAIWILEYGYGALHGYEYLK